jgi:hypothetical protein
MPELCDLCYQDVIEWRSWALLRELPLDDQIVITPISVGKEKAIAPVVIRVPPRPGVPAVGPGRREP